MDLTARVTAALERSILPTVIARGAAVRVAAAGDGVVTLEVTEYPGRRVPAGLPHRGTDPRRRP